MQNVTDSEISVIKPKFKCLFAGLKRVPKSRPHFQLMRYWLSIGHGFAPLVSLPVAALGHLAGALQYLHPLAVQGFVARYLESAFLLVGELGTMRLEVLELALAA
jgi:hypothetical protein